MTQPFSDQELDQLAAQVEAELRELAAFPPDFEHKGVSGVGGDCAAYRHQDGVHGG